MFFVIVWTLSLKVSNVLECWPVAAVLGLRLWICSSHIFGELLRSGSCSMKLILVLLRPIDGSMEADVDCG